MKQQPAMAITSGLLNPQASAKPKRTRFRGAETDTYRSGSGSGSGSEPCRAESESDPNPNLAQGKQSELRAGILEFGRDSD